MKSFQLKALAAAVLALAGINAAYAVTCPDPAANGNTGYQTPNGPWTQENVNFATIASAAGLNGTNCSMAVNFSAAGSGVSGSAAAFVNDGSPQNEPRYRARFYIDIANSGAITSANSQMTIFSAVANFGPPGSRANVVKINLVGGSTRVFRFLVSDFGAGGKTKTINVPAPTQAGVNRIEFDYNTGTNSTCAPGNTHGSFCVWVTDGAAASGSDSTPVGAPAYNLLANSFDSNHVSGWTGVKFANLGIASPSVTLQGAGAQGQGVYRFDEFDSRRQTFIGQ